MHNLTFSSLVQRLLANDNTWHIRYLQCLIIVCLASIPFTSISTPIVVANNLQPVSTVKVINTQIAAVSTPPIVPAPPIPPPQPVVPSYPSDKTSIMSAAGISPEDYQYVDYVIGQESGWCATKWEGQYGYCPGHYVEEYSTESNYVGYGLCQSTPAIKMASISDDWADNPVTQMKWCTQYAMSYGGWARAAEFKRCVGYCFNPRIVRYINKATPWW